MHFPSTVIRHLFPCALFAVFLLTFSDPCRAGIVNIISQDSYISVDADGTQRIQHSTSLDGFAANDTQNYPLTVSQSTTFTPTAAGGESFTSHGTSYSGPTGSSDSVFKVTFDLSASADYALIASQSTGTIGQTAALLQGPTGDIRIVAGLPPERDGSLLPGRYTLSSNGQDGLTYDVRLDLTPSTAALPLPAALWTALPIMLLLSAASFIHTRRRTQSTLRWNLPSFL